jgi:hypothetical protein
MHCSRSRFARLLPGIDNDYCMKYLFFVITFLCCSTVFSQEIITGHLLGGTVGQPVAYGNIGIVNTPVGTLSNEDGTFLISIPVRYFSDSLIFSALGYQSQSISIRSLLTKKNVEVVLTEKAIVLNEVVVKGRKKSKKTYELGNRYTKGGFLYADSTSSGAAIALLIDNKYPSYHSGLKSPYFLEEVRVFISRNSIDNFKLRIRFYARDSVSALPSADLFSENIILTSSVKNGWLKIDLTPYNLSVAPPFFLSVEWIMDQQDRLELLNQYATFRKDHPDKVVADSTVVEGKKIGFWSYLGFDPGTHLGVSPIPFSLQNYECYYRMNSFGAWNRAPVILTARVLVSPLDAEEHAGSRK